MPETERTRVTVEVQQEDPADQQHHCDGQTCCRRINHRLDMMERQLAELLRRTPDRVPARIELSSS